MLSSSKRSLALLFTLSLALLPALGFAGEYQLNMTEGVTSVSKAVYGLHMLIFYICCIIGVIVFGAMFYLPLCRSYFEVVKNINFMHNI